jgi:uncharacterized protein (TIGR00369 family)
VSASSTEPEGLSESPRRTHGHVLAALDMYDVPATAGCDWAMEMPVTREVSNNRGGLQGGLLTTLIDVAAGICAIQGLPPGETAATSDITVHFLTGVTVGPARADVKVLRHGKTKIVLRVEVFDTGRDVLAATSTVAFTKVQLRDGQPDHRQAPRAKHRGEGSE